MPFCLYSTHGVAFVFCITIYNFLLIAAQIAEYDHTNNNCRECHLVTYHWL